jgi:hypothetical protein
MTTQSSNQANGLFAFLYPYQFILLTTFRKNGTTATIAVSLSCKDC